MDPCRRSWATPTSRRRSCALQCPSRRRQKRAAFSLPARDVKPDSPRFKDTPACSTTRRLQASSPSFPSRSDKFVDQTQALRNAFAASPNTPTRTWTRPPSTRTSVRSSNAPTSATGAPARRNESGPHLHVDRASAGGAFCCALRQRRLSAVHLNERARRRVHDAPQCGDGWSRAVPAAPCQVRPVVARRP